MARRKRLTAANPAFFGADGEPEEGRGRTSGPAPIAQVAGEAAAQSALAEIAGELEAARTSGRLVEILPLEQIDETYLVRDRLEQDEDEMVALVDSLRARGQQTPIEVIRLPEPAGGKTHGLISGWRRLSALRRLHANTGDDAFAGVRALVIAPETASDAYVAMVEENEIRVNLSHYERARIALKAVQEGVYPSKRAALQGLYASTTRSKRSKIGSFIRVVEALDKDLRFPAAISEKLGLALARDLSAEPGFARKLKAALKAKDCTTAAEETRVLAAVLKGQGGRGPDRISVSEEKLGPELRLRFDAVRGRVELRGNRVTDTLVRDLRAWLAER